MTRFDLHAAGLAAVSVCLAFSACAGAPSSVPSSVPSAQSAHTTAPPLLPAASAARRRVLVILSGSNRLTLRDGGVHPTGYYLNELAVPLKALLDAGYEPVFANPRGSPPVVDVRSDSPAAFGGDGKRYEAMKVMLSHLPQFQNPRSFYDVLREGLDGFDALFAPGGHAPMEDLTRNEELGRILTHFHARAKPTALICHAPVELLSAGPAAGRGKATWPYKGYRLTVFSKAEEQVAEDQFLGGRVKFYPESKLRARGAHVDNGPKFQSHVVVDRELITGQNPQSDDALARALVEALQAHAR